jgi:phosphate transport system substrate-binding protein
MKYGKLTFLFTVLAFVALASCKRKKQSEAVGEKRTSGATTILVDETYADILDRQIQVFRSDYPDAEVNTIVDNENKIIDKFASGEVKMIILSRMLKPSEEAFYKKRESPVYVDRFAIDGLALITSRSNTDTTISVSEVLSIMKGESKLGKKLVFDNPYSSTLRYFVDSSKIKVLPKDGVYTLNSTKDVIDFVAKNNNYIGVVGYNWLLNQRSQEVLSTIKTVAIRNDLSKDKSNIYYKPTQESLISGKYPFLRNIYVMNGEGRSGLGTGFATWLTSPRGQLIVHKSGLGPHKVANREFNIKSNNKK